MSSSTAAWLGSSSEPSKPCCSHWAITSPPGRTESHPLVRSDTHFLSVRVLACRSAWSDLPEWVCGMSLWVFVISDELWPLGAYSVDQRLRSQWPCWRDKIVFHDSVRVNTCVTFCSSDCIIMCDVAFQTRSVMGSHICLWRQIYKWHNLFWRSPNSNCMYLFSEVFLQFTQVLYGGVFLMMNSTHNCNDTTRLMKIMWYHQV